MIKSPVHTARVPLLRKLFPKAKFIYIHRHPEVVFQSSAHLADTTYWYCYLNTPSNERVTSFIFWQFQRLWTTYNDAVLLTPEHSKEGGDKKECNHKERRLTDDVLELGYTDLVRQPLASLRRIYAYLKIPFQEERFSSPIAALSGYKVNEHADLDGELLKRIRVEWREYYHAFGYEADKDVPRSE